MTGGKERKKDREKEEKKERKIGRKDERKKESTKIKRATVEQAQTALTFTLFI
jgi:hypothetical protein